MFGRYHLIIDTAAGIALAITLLVVFLLDRLLSSPVRPQNTLEVTIVDDSSRRQERAKKLRLAVTPAQVEKLVDPVSRQTRLLQWENMPKLLHELGEGYRYDEIGAPNIAANPNLLDAYDVLFLTCAPGGQELRDALVQFVGRGGTLYASDWRYEAVAAAFPDVVQQATQGNGIRQSVQARVVDPALREHVGEQIPLQFDLDVWKTAAFEGARVTPLIDGNYQRMQHPKDRVGVPAHAPLLAKFQFGKGTVVFTSFHTEKQRPDLAKKLLHYLVFSLVTAEIDTQVKESIQGAGFAPQKSNILSTPKSNPSVQHTYHNAKAGPLRFALGFRNEGAKLRLELKAPDGRSFTWEGTSTIILEVPQAAAGEWTYTVTTLELPYENFPFTVSVSEKR